MAQSEGKKSLDKIYYDELYLELESFLYSERIPIAFLRPLTSFTSEKEVRISDSLRIRRMSIAEREEWVNLIIVPDISHLAMETTHTVEYRQIVPKKFGEQPTNDSGTKVTERISDVIAALRLLKIGSFQDFYSIPRVDMNIPDRHFSLGSQLMIDIMPLTRYELLSTDVPTLLSDYELITKMRNFKEIKNALNWLHNYSKEYDHPKRIVYLAVVLETFFTKEGEKDSLTHKLRCRAANLLASTYHDKKRIYENINSFYSVRSSILHGEDKQYFDKLDETDGYVRSAIRKILVTVTNFRVEDFKSQYSEFLTKLDLDIK